MIEVEDVTEDSLVQLGDKLILAEELISKVSEEIGVTSFKNLKIFNGDSLSDCICEHPFKSIGSDLVMSLF